MAIQIDSEAIFAQVPRLETKRLLLREITPEDAAAVLDIYGDAVTGQFNAWTPISGMEEAQDKIRFFQSLFRERQRIRWGIALKESDQLIGDCALVKIDLRNARAEIGFNLVRSQWRKGYMREALNRMIDHLFRVWRFNRLEAVVMPENVGSFSLLQELGFVREGRLRQAGYVNGAFCDLDMYALLAKQMQVDY